MTEEEIDQHLEYLIETSAQFAEATSLSKYYEKFLKSVESKYFLESTGTIDHRKSVARTNPEYISFLEKSRNADYDFALINANREASKLAISLYQSRLKATNETKY